VTGTTHLKCVVPHSGKKERYCSTWTSTKRRPWVLRSSLSWVNRWYPVTEESTYPPVPCRKTPTYWRWLPTAKVSMSPSRTHYY
jgi:hypothetical protein